ncbi:MAG: hypothetical protein HY269_09135, partial [Deltaproteobacteria bacterium]|nr:hypothetical protein [Deltaproteobacteria bacterium]
MSENKTRTVPSPQQLKRALSRPGAIVLLVANLLPLAGVIFWGWDAFLLLTLYWMETIVFAFWTVVWIATADPASVATLKFNDQRDIRPIALAVFFAFHAGMFIGVHLLFLWVLFSGDWPQRTGGVLGFFKHAIVAEGLWVPLVILFIARGVFLFGDILARLWRAKRAQLPQQAEQKSESVLLELYGRIFVMQVAIIIGAWFAMVIGSVGPLILMILCKTAIDLLWQAFQ